MDRVSSCSFCATRVPHGARFCPSCGAPVDRAGTEAVRKPVTILFSDVVGSTALAERMDPEKWGRIMTAYFSEMHAILARHGGVVEKYVGDAVLAVFGFPTVHEDDALRACRAAVEMDVALTRLNERFQSTFGVTLQTRTGVNTGEVVATASTRDQTLPLGDPANLAARLEAAAPPGEIYIGEATWNLVRHAVLTEPVPPLALKGKQTPVAAWRLVAAETTPGTALPVRLDSPLVGRDAELDALREAVDDAIADRSCRSVTVVGEPGVGKSRLALELVDRVSGTATVLRGRCLSYGEGITFWPLAEILKQAAGIDERTEPDEATAALRRLLGGHDDAERIALSLASAIGWSDVAIPVEEVFWAARATIEHLARAEPLVVVIDDIHWAEERLLDLIEHLGRSTAGVPIVLLALARPDVLDSRPAWGRNVAGHTVLRLPPLTDENTGLFASKLLDENELPANLRNSLSSASEGNPLFIEQLVASWLDEGILQRTGGAWTLTDDPRSLGVPSSLRSLLQSRIDRLPGVERSLLELASVIGQVFQERAIKDLANGFRDDADLALAALAGSGFLDEYTETSTPEPSYRFRHVLLRDAAYESALKSRRAEMHERFGRWLADDVGHRLTEYGEIVGYHLEQAYRYLSELGSIDEHARGLARQAFGHLAAAGSRALARADATAAANLLTRAASLLPHDDRERLALLPALGEALADAGRLADADRALREAMEAAAMSGDDVLRARATAVWAELQQYVDPSWGEDEMERTAREILPVLEAAGDHGPLAKATYLLTKHHISRGNFDALEALIDQIIEHARRAGDVRHEAVMRAFLCTQGLWGPVPVPDAIDRCHRTLRWTEETPGTDIAVGLVMRALAALEAMIGRFRDARTHVAKSSSIFDGLGLIGSWAGAQDAAAEIELLAGQPDAADAILRAALGAAELLGAYAHGITVRLAEAAFLRGDIEEADDLTVRSADYRHHPDADNAASWGAIRARVLARLGRIEEAIEIAREANSKVADGGYVESRAATHVALGEAFAAAGRSGDADAEFAEALALYEQKGDTVRPRLLRESHLISSQ